MFYCDLPVRLYQADSRDDRLFPLTVLSVAASEGTPHSYKVPNIGNRRRVQIGDPDTTISGAHCDVITYRVRSVLTGFPDHDELNWNAIGTEWAPVELVPPDDVRPGQRGTLIDEVANTLDVTASIIDLAVRGYLRIDEIARQGWSEESRRFIDESDNERTHVGEQPGSGSSSSGFSGGFSGGGGDGGGGS